MKAIRIHRHGGPEVLSYEDVPVPEPAPNEALVKVEAAGVNFIDIYFRTGLYPTKLPITNGQEGAGTVAAVGSSVAGVAVGDRVAYTGTHGSYAEYAAVQADRLVEVPDGVDTKTAAAAMLQGMTAHYLTRSTFEIAAGHTALIHACAGGVGLLLVELAKKFGARVLGTCSTEAKAAKARAAGADEVILYTEQDFEAECKRITGGRGVDVVYDSVGKSTWIGSLNSLKPRGLMVTFGNASGPVPPTSPLELTKRGSLLPDATVAVRLCRIPRGVGMAGAGCLRLDPSGRAPHPCGGRVSAQRSRRSAVEAGRTADDGQAALGAVASAVRVERPAGYVRQFAAPTAHLEQCGSR